MVSQSLIFIIVAVTFLNIVALCFSRKPQTVITTSMSTAVITSLCGLLGAGILLAGGKPLVLTLTYLSPFGELRLVSDNLGHFFMLITALVWFPVSIFSFSYLHKYAGRYDLRLFGALYNLLFLALIFTVLSGDMVGFLISWEIAAIISYLLVNFKYEKPLVTRAGLVMIVMGEVGTVLMMAAFVLLYNYTGHLDFAGIRAFAGTLPAGVKNAVFFLALAGFGIKAGLVPLQQL
uniref:NADH:quinone oxidoreductase/Mrp antiporter transmembrane domain-containing protein n=1 Tax=Ammonifex degensii TaxID=42838 RepID=A0A7C2I3P3_9THEO